MSHFLQVSTPIAHWLFVPQIQRAMPTHKAKSLFTPTTTTVPLMPKKTTQSYIYITPSYKTNPAKSLRTKNQSLSYKGIMQNSRCNPTHLGFPHSPFKAQFFQCATQLAFKGKFVNPLKTDAIGSISNRLLFVFASVRTSLHQNLKQNLTSSQIENPLQGARVVSLITKSGSFLTTICSFLHLHLLGRHRQHFATTSGTKVIATLHFR